MSTLERGVTIAGYRVDGVLGMGGMGVVYRATQLSLNRVVALKVLAAELSEDTNFRERFRREGQLQAAIDHPHIVTVYEAGESDHGLFIAMRVVQGPTLKDLIGGGRLDPARTVALLVQVADALDAAHEKGLIHRDVKPQNILVDANDRAYLADFGLTRAPDGEGPTETGQFVGTLDYISPEQARGDGATGASDVYALTGVLCEALTGDVPYVRQSEAAVMFAHLSEPPPQPTGTRPELPAAIDAVIAHGMAKDPTQRPASARALMEEAAEALEVSSAPGPAAVTRPHQVSLDTVQRSAAAGATRVSTAAPPAAAARGRGPALAIGAVALVLAVVAGFAIGGSGSKSGGSTAALPQSASASAVQLSFPAGWRRVAGAPAIRGLSFTDPLVLEGGARSPGRLTAGEVDATGATLLPAALHAGRGQAVSLGGLQALRYRGVTAPGSSTPMTIYAVPTTSGVATIACSPSATGAAAFLRTCDQAAGTLKLIGVKAYPLGPSPAHAYALTRELSALKTRRAGAERALAAAGTPSAQAAAAATLAGLYRTSSRRLDRLAVTPYAKAAHGRLVFALRSIGDTYAAAASAARSGDRAAYARAQTGVRHGGQALGRALAALKALGYTVSA